MTTAQRDALVSGGLDDYCMEHHTVCVHCGTCTMCHSGCQCANPDCAEDCNCGGCEEYEGETDDDE